MSRTPRIVITVLAAVVHRHLLPIVAASLLASAPVRAQTITTLAGNGLPDYCGDGKLASDACLYYPYGVAVDAQGNVFIADQGNNRVRRVSTAGVITTVAGNGEDRFCGDGGPATSACLSYPRAVAVDATGALYIADWGNGRIRKVLSSGIITTVAGSGSGGYCGDDGPAAAACLLPMDVAVGAAGELFIADWLNSRIRKVDAGGTITTVAGSGLMAFCGDGGPAASACLTLPRGVAVDAAGELFIADTGNNRIRKVDAGGTITTVAGGGMGRLCGDYGPATEACLSAYAIAVNAAGYLFIADAGNGRIRMVDTTGTITTVAGGSEEAEYCGDGGPATEACLNSPTDAAVSADGTIFIADESNHRIRQVPFGIASLTIAKSLISGCRTTVGKVTLAPRVGHAAVTVTLHSSSPNAAVPPSVTIARGRQAKAFSITTTAVARRETVTITATGPLGTTRTATITLRPMTPASLQFAQNPVVGGSTVTGTVTLECAAGPGNVTVALTSRKPWIARPFSESVKVLRGSTTASFAIITTGVSDATNVSIRAKAHRVTKARALVVNPG